MFQNNDLIFLQLLTKIVISATELLDVVILTNLCFESENASYNKFKHDPTKLNTVAWKLIEITINAISIGYSFHSHQPDIYPLLFSGISTPMPCALCERMTPCISLVVNALVAKGAMLDVLVSLDDSNKDLLKQSKSITKSFLYLLLTEALVERQRGRNPVPFIHCWIKLSTSRNFLTDRNDYGAFDHASIVIGYLLWTSNGNTSIINECIDAINVIVEDLTSYIPSSNLLNQIANSVNPIDIKAVLFIHGLLTTSLLCLIQTETNHDIIMQCSKLADAIDSILLSINQSMFSLNKKSSLVPPFHINDFHYLNIISHHPLIHLTVNVLYTAISLIVSPHDFNNQLSSSTHVNSLNVIWRRLPIHGSPILRDLQSYLIAVILKLSTSSHSKIFCVYCESSNVTHIPSCSLCSSHSPYLGRLCLLKLTSLHCIFDLATIHGSIYVDRYLPILTNLIGTYNTQSTSNGSNSFSVHPCAFLQSSVLNLIGFSGDEKLLLPVR